MDAGRGVGGVKNLSHSHSPSAHHKLRGRSTHLEPFSMPVTGSSLPQTEMRFCRRRALVTRNLAELRPLPVLLPHICKSPFLKKKSDISPYVLIKQFAFIILRQGTAGLKNTSLYIYAPQPSYTSISSRHAAANLLTLSINTFRPSHPLSPPNTTL